MSYQFVVSVAPLAGPGSSDIDPLPKTPDVGSFPQVTQMCLRLTPRTLLSSAALVAVITLATVPTSAQTVPGVLSPRPTAPPESTAYTLIHVNARSGSDISGDGSQLRPYQTLTHALRLATANTIVLLAAGDYSEATGERFPIQLRSGVTVQGMPGSAWGQTVIRGSGPWASTTVGMLHATLLGADGAGLGYVMVTNPSPAGYGLVIEAGRPTIRHNQFTGSGYGGVYVSGHSAPLLEENQFSRNGVVGLVLTGQSTAEVRGNRFEQTGIGIRVAPGAQPHILNNTIVQNQDGLLLDGSANPYLRDNVIAQNRRNGVVEFQTALKVEETVVGAGLPPVAWIAPGGQAATPPPSPLTAASPQVRPMMSPVTPVAIVTPPPATPVPTVAPLPPAQPRPVAPATPPAIVVTPPVPMATALPLADPLPVGQPQVTPAPAQPSVSVAPASLPVTVGLATESTPITVPLPAVSTPTAPSSQGASSGGTPPEPSPTVVAARDNLRRLREAQASATPSEEEGIPIAVIPPPAEIRSGGNPQAPVTPVAPTVAAQPSVPVVAPSPQPNAALLPVPGGAIPRGRGTHTIPALPPPTTPTTLALNGHPPTLPSYGSLLGLVYKVVVPAADAATQAQVRARVTDAFRVTLEGQTMMQVGAYADQATAEARARDLIDQGLDARVEYRP